MSTPPPAPAIASSRPSPATHPPENKGLSEGQKRALVIGGVILVILALAGAITAAVFLVGRPTQAAAVRDVFIIFMALEFMFIGVAMVILIVQLAVLTNMLQHEIKPILESTNETVNTVRGTALFVSENLVEPVMKLNSYVAALSKALESLGALGGFGRKR